ncbi:MAG: hypothetical protein HC813_03985, partial [Planctomycetes bacterium]|nr:hypothetical protein [Planctomycetota bacterium]
MADRRHNDRFRLLMGLGLDSDGHSRITKGEDFLLLGGTEETHGTMQEKVERLNHTLDRMGTSFQHASEEELREAADRSGLSRRPRRRPRGSSSCPSRRSRASRCPGPSPSRPRGTCRRPRRPP